MALSPRIVQLLEQYQLDAPVKVKRALDGYLANAARLYAKRAGYLGQDMAIWNVRSNASVTQLSQ